MTLDKINKEDSMAASLNLLACQIEIPTTNTAADRNRHLENTARKVTSAAIDADVQVIVLPELSSIDYSRASFDQLEQLAEPLDGPSTECWANVATTCRSHVVYSFPRRGKNGFYICVAVVDASGNLLGHYDKMHLAQYGASMEKDYFDRGDHLFTFAIDGIRLAPIICYDIRFPELCRNLTIDHQVSVVLHCGAYYRDESFFSWHDFVRTRAIENQIYFLSLNRAGLHYGHSLFCPPWVDETVSATEFATHDEDFRIVQIMPDHVAKIRQEYSFLQDRLKHY